MGEAILSDHMADRFGDYGCLEPEVGEWLQSPWRQGNAADIFSLFEQNGLGELIAAPCCADGSGYRKRRHPVTQFDWVVEKNGIHV